MQPQQTYVNPLLAMGLLVFIYEQACLTTYSSQTSMMFSGPRRSSVAWGEGVMPISFFTDYLSLHQGWWMKFRNSEGNKMLFGDEINHQIYFKLNIKSKKYSPVMKTK